jgi:hypothetical protein
MLVLPDIGYAKICCCGSTRRRRKERSLRSFRSHACFLAVKHSGMSELRAAVICGIGHRA